MPGGADEEERLLGDGGDDHEVDDFLFLDEESAEGGAEAVDLSTQFLGFGLEVLESGFLRDGNGHESGNLGNFDRWKANPEQRSILKGERQKGMFGLLANLGRRGVSLLGESRD